MTVDPLCFRHLARLELLKHPQNPYSIERASHKLSITPSHALLDAVGGLHDHFECAARALFAQSWTRREQAGPIRGRADGGGQRSGREIEIKKY